MNATATAVAFDNTFPPGEGIRTPLPVWQGRIAYSAEMR